MSVCSLLGTLIKQAFADSNSISIGSAYEDSGCIIQRHTLQDTYLDVAHTSKRAIIKRKPESIIHFRINSFS